MSTKLYVGNLAFQTTREDLQELFAQAGTVESASVVEDRMTGRSRGFAFVEMSTPEEAAAAIEQMNGREVGGRALKVNEAKPRENRGAVGAAAVDSAATAAAVATAVVIVVVAAAVAKGASAAAAAAIANHVGKTVTMKRVASSL